MIAWLQNRRFVFFGICAFYVALYWWFLHRSGYLPYVFDNNETYSSLVHAYNMYFGDWSKSFGLTDEAFNPDPAAHPAIHTHQGNWPRILAFVLFALGFRSPESQITIHVFSIGLLSIYLMFRFFSKIVNPYFAALVCTIFMTDYVLFMQWQVVTYRVWHCFFLFLSLNCMLEFDTKKLLWKVLFVLNFMALYYWELVFAFYVSCWSLIFYMLKHGQIFSSQTIKKTFKCGLYIACSGILALGILFTQLSLFMGLKNALKDYYLTFFARNMAENPEWFRTVLEKFYAGKDVAFFYNIVDGSIFKTFSQYFRSLFNYGFEVHTPILSSLAVIGLYGVIINNWNSRANKNQKLSMTVASKWCHLAIWFFLCIIFSGTYFLAIGQKYRVFHGVASIVLLYFASAFVKNLVLQTFYPRSESVDKQQFERALIFLGAVSIFYLLQPIIYNGHFGEIWNDTLTAHFNINIWRFIVAYTVLIVFCSIIVKPEIFKNKHSLKTLLLYLSAGFCAYNIIYFLSPGYLFSGYLTRSAPFIVFLVDVIIAICLWIMFNAVVYFVKVSRSNKPLLNNHIASKLNLFAYAKNNIMLVLAVATSMLLAYQWFYNQYKYYKIFPPQIYGFIKQLRNSQFQGQAVATNQYSLPFAYETNSWGLMDSNIGAWSMSFDGKKYAAPVNTEYLWYKNRHTNPGYLTPGYYVCFESNSFSLAVNRVRARGEALNLCSHNPPIAHAKAAEHFETSDSRLRHKLLAIDTKNDGWALVKLDWEYPPFLAKFSGTDRYFKTVYNNDSNSLKVEYIFKQQNGVEEFETIFKIYTVDTKGTKKLYTQKTARSNSLDIEIPKSANRLFIEATPATIKKHGISISELVVLNTGHNN